MSRDIILSVLKNSNSYVSGEQLSAKLGISRAAVNSYIKKLRVEGYDIESSTNKGYRLSSYPDVIDKGMLMSYLDSDRCRNVFCYDVVTSTNDFLKKLAQDGAEEGTIIVSNKQTAGRGRMGKSFESPQNAGIYFSYLYRPKTDPNDISEATAWVAIAVARAIDKIYGITTEIKWINDLIFNNKKICGILNELSIEGESLKIQYMISGIGINIDDTVNGFSDDINPIATSLYRETGKRIDKNCLVAEMIKELDRLKEDWPKNKKSYLDEYRKRCVNVNKRVLLKRGEMSLEAEAIGIDDNFRLVVKYDDGAVDSVSSGEVSVRGLYGYV